MLKKVKTYFQNIKNKFTTKEQWVLRLISLLIGLTICFILIYVFCTNPGFLIRESFERAFTNDHEVRTIEVYSGSQLLKTFEGHYGVEQYQGYLVIINYDTHERTDIYGNTAVLINSKQELLNESNIKE